MIGSLPAAAAQSYPGGREGTAPGTGLPLGSGGGPPGGAGANGPANAPPALHPVPGGEVAETGTRTPDGNAVVRVFVSNAALRAGEGGWWALLVGGSLGLLVFAVLAGELLTRRIVRPLLSTARTAHDLSAGDITARAPTDGPREVAEVGAALNRLADRIDELIAEERETVADLSHRMRTPLTALRLDAEALRDAAEAERVGEHVSVLERTLTAVIHAARRPQREGRLPSSDAVEVVAARVRFWSALAEDQGRAVQVAFPPGPLLVRASGDDLGAALDALLENVIAHTPEGAGFAVRLAVESGESEGGDEGDTVAVTVSDEGPGLPADGPARGRSDRGSSGLGLDIARRCAESAGGSMTLGRSPAGGAEVTLRLRRP